MATKKTLTDEQVAQLTSHQRRRYMAGVISAEEVLARGWLGSQKPRRGPKADKVAKGAGKGEDAQDGAQQPSG